MRLYLIETSITRFPKLCVVTSKALIINVVYTARGWQ